MTTKRYAVAALLILAAANAGATGVTTCDSGPSSGWQPEAKLEKMLSEQGMKVRRIKVDGGCYEAYVTDKNGKRAELYFHPKTLEPVTTSQTTKR
jgi:hypothetical protein